MFGPQGEGVPPIVHDVLRSPGQPLHAATRVDMEGRFGHDFSGVRVHTDSGAAKSAEAVYAKAYTAGKNIVFGQGRYAPDTGAGRHLLAHELSHVVQQSRDGHSHAAAAECDAGRAADHVDRGGIADVATSAQVSIQRDPLSDVEIAQLDEAKLKARLRENDREARNFQLVQPLEILLDLQREQRSLGAALDRTKNAANAAPLATVTPANQTPVHIHTTATDELVKERNRVKSKLSTLDESSIEFTQLKPIEHLLDMEFQQRRSDYEEKVRGELAGMAKTIDAKLAGQDRSNRYKTHDFVDSLTVEGYGEEEFQIFCHGRRRGRVTALLTQDDHPWVISLGVVNFVTGEAKPASYVEFRGGAESEGIGPLEYIIDIASGIGVIRTLGRLALRGAARSFSAAGAALARSAAPGIARGELIARLTFGGIKSSAPALAGDVAPRAALLAESLGSRVAPPAVRGVGSTVAKGVASTETAATASKVATGVVRANTAATVPAGVQSAPLAGAAPGVSAAGVGGSVAQAVTGTAGSTVGSQLVGTTTVQPSPQPARNLSRNELLEPAVQQRYHPNASILSAKSAGFDFVEGQRRVSAHTEQLAGATRVEEVIAGGKWTQLKIVSNTAEKDAIGNARTAIEKAADTLKGIPKGALETFPGPRSRVYEVPPRAVRRENAFERVSGTHSYRTSYAGQPDEIEIHLHFENLNPANPAQAARLKELEAAAQREIHESPYLVDLPPVRLRVTGGQLE
jgi:hypothetical protein